MSTKIPPLFNGRAVGYWGRNIRARITTDQTYDKVTQWDLDKQMSMGLPFAIWREASSLQNGLSQCSCFKDTSKQPDIPCLSCYGTGKIPGYFKFGTKTFWAASIDSGWTLNNIVLDKTNRPFRFMLADGQTSGTAISQQQFFSTTDKLGNWEFKVDGFTRDGGANSTITTEYSIDTGTTWNDISNINTIVPVDNIMFRVTLTRTATTVKTPMFEIVRVRFQNVPDIRGELSEPIIRVLPTWDVNAENRTVYGDRIESSGKRFWCMPLCFYDTTLDRETSKSRLMDDVFCEVRYGGNIGIRFALINFSYSDTFGIFTRQEFNLRQYAGSPNQQQGEFAYRVF